MTSSGGTIRPQPVMPATLQIATVTAPAKAAPKSLVSNTRAASLCPVRRHLFEDNDGPLQILTAGLTDDGDSLPSLASPVIQRFGSNGDIGKREGSTRYSQFIYPCTPTVESPPSILISRIPRPG
jgi:hypothetical protein